MPARELEICRNLRAFRERLQIPRSRFAMAIGIGSERVAGYELERAPVQFDIYRAVYQRFQINPHWLAKGVGEPETKIGVDDSELAKTARPRALFSEIYDEKLSALFAELSIRTWLTVADSTLYSLINQPDLQKGLLGFPALAMALEDHVETLTEIFKKLHGVGSSIEQTTARKRAAKTK